MTASLWRVTRRRFADLRGEGARLYGGRWNPVGVPCVYLSSTLSLAVLETLVHTDPDLIPPDLVAVRVDVDGLDAQEPDPDDLPGDWLTEIGNSDTQAFGAAWARSERTPLLVLPSALLPPSAGAAERNILLNPSHPDARPLDVAATTPFSFDSRLFSREAG